MMHKFVIYRSETGLFYRNYYDDMQQLSDNPLGILITEDMLPIVDDGKGGYYRFSEKDPGFVEVRECETDYPLPLEAMFYKNHKNFRLGWISPDGDTFSCGFMDHSRAAKMICNRFYPNSNNPEIRLGKAGWLKIIDSWNGTEQAHGQFVYSSTRHITQRQLDKLYDLGLYNNPEVKELLK